MGFEFGGDRRDLALDPIRVETRRAEEPEEPGPTGGDHQLSAGDPVGHGPGDVRKARAMHLAEAAVAEPLGVERGQDTDDVDAVLGTRARGVRVGETSDLDADRPRPCVANDEERLAHEVRCRSDLIV